MTQFEKSAIIGYWRSGTQLSEIAIIMDLTLNEVVKVIVEYIKNKTGITL